MTYLKISEAFRNISNSKEELEFLSIFDPTRSVQESISSGFTDLIFRIFTNDMLKLIGNPSEFECCEIGFGAGRLLLPFSFIFKHAHGIDIHNNFERVEKRLNSFNRSNFTLHKAEEAYEKIADKSIKFAYSFIVFQHFESWETAEFYLDFLDKKLSDDGCAIIFFGKNNHNNEDVFTPLRDASNDWPITLFVKEDFVRKEISKKFKIIEVGTTNKRPWLNEPSKQFFVKFKK